MSKPSVDLSILKRFLKSEFPAHRKQVALAAVFMVFAALSATASAWIIKYVIDDLFVAQRMDRILPIGFAIVLIYLIKGSASYAYSVILAQVSAKLTASLRINAIHKILRREIWFFDETEPGDLVNRIANVTASAANLIRVITTTVMRDILSIVFLVAFMFYSDWRLTLLTFLIAPPIIIGVTQISRRIQNSVASEFENQTRFIQQLFERMSGIRLVRTSGAEPQTEEMIDKTISTLKKRSIKIARISALNSPLMETLGGFAVAAMIIYSSYSVASGYNTAGDVFAFIVAFINVYEPIKRLATFRVELVRSVVPLGYYYELVDQEPKQEFGSEVLAKAELDVVFDDVSFAYQNREKSAVSHLSFQANANEFTALVGRSGSGKSTVFSLLQRFYDVSEGRIYIGGKEIRSLSKEALYGAIASIPQETTIFAGSIAENIAVARPDATREAIMAAANAAHMDEFVSQLPDGLDTLIGEGNTSLSGGQKQRLSIARAILKDAPIVLLDEATSALDSEAEAIVQKAIGAATKGKTVLVIAHRLSTIRGADKILVLDQGKIAEEGTHDALVARDGIYATLRKLQFEN